MEDNHHYQGFLYIGGVGKVNRWKRTQITYGEFPLWLRIFIFTMSFLDRRKKDKSELFLGWGSKDAKYVRNLRKVNILPSIVREYENTLLFPPEQLSLFKNEWYSSQLSALDEIKLAKCAQLENVVEVYRLTVLPSFHPPMVYRISFGQFAKLIFKTGKSICGITAAVESIITQNLDNAAWQEFVKLLENESFWTKSSWNTLPSGTIGMDGTTFVIEGWKNGEYKYLSDWQPQQDSSIYKTVEYLEDLYSHTYLEKYLRSAHPTR